jgi:nucleotide-binding universal stress UspA family protein
MAVRTRGGTVLCATDLTETAEEAVRQAHEAARGRKARLLALHVLPDPLRQHPLLPVGRQVRYARLPAEHARASDEMRAHLVRALGDRAAAVDLQIEHGRPHAAIIACAEDVGAELIVVGVSASHVGHEAERVVRYAHGPVLVARPSPPGGGVLVATDLSDAALPAVAAGVSHARRHGLPLALLHVVDLRPWLRQPDFAATASVPLADGLRESLTESARDRLQKALRRFRATGDVVVESGEPAAVILERAARLPAGLVVLGTTGATGVKRMVLGSVAEAVVRHASCSALVVRLPTRSARRVRRAA